MLPPELNIKENVNIKPYTTFGVGGTARYFAEVDRARDIISLIKFAKKNNISYVVIAGGSNVVFDDGVLDMLVIKLEPKRIFRDNGEFIEGMKDYIVIKDDELVCDAGAKLLEMIRFAIESGFGGLESLSGIPGSVGGAVVGNAGAYGQTASGTLKEVEIFDGEEIRVLPKSECRFAYRESIFKNKPWLVLTARFILKSGDAEVLQKTYHDIIETRNKKYSPEIKCAGSFFKNILIESMPRASLKFLPQNRDYFGKVPAWHFLDAVGAKGMTEGGIKIADFHGNLLMNMGDATFGDVTILAQKLKDLVKEKFGIELEEEVRYIR